MKEPEYDNYLVCPKCKEKNLISKKQYLGLMICECKTFCPKCKHKDYWAYGFYMSKSY